MNRSLLLLIICLSLLFPIKGVMAQGGPKLGHVDHQTLMLELPERKKAEQKVQAFAQRLQKDIEAMNEEYRSKVTAYQESKASMTRTEQESEVSKLTNLQERISKARQNAQENLQKQEQELLEPVYARIDSAINKVAKAQGFAYIFDASSGALIHKGGTDITPAVMESLGIERTASDS